MAIRDIVLFPNIVLTTPTKAIEVVDDELRDLVQDLADTMYDAPGIGLAAPQIGVLKRVAVIDTSPPDEEPNLLVLINPQVVERSGAITWEEGCLSFPRLYEKIDRAHDVLVKAMDLEGQEFEIAGSELMAVVLQHEIDHLDGVVFTERMSRLKRLRALKRYKKILEEIEHAENNDDDE